MAISDTVKKQLVEFIMLQVFDDQYIDRQEEKKILEEGIKKGISVDEGLAIIREVAYSKDFVIERDIEERTKEFLEQFIINDGSINKKAFETALILFRSTSKGKVPEPEIKKQVKTMVLDNCWKVKEGGLFGSKWFSEI